jgi:hypothetical protein
VKHLVIAVLVAALLSLGYRLVGTITADADSAPPPPKRETPPEVQPNNLIQPAVGRVDSATTERNLARNETSGPNRTRRGDEAGQRSCPVPRSTAKPYFGTTGELATARTPPPAPPILRMVGPDGLVYHKVGTAPSTVSALRLTPPPTDEPLVQAPPAAPEPAPLVRDDKPLSSEPLAPPATIAPAHGKTVGPDGIEFHPIQRAR